MLTTTMAGVGAQLLETPPWAMMMSLPVAGQQHPAQTLPGAAAADATWSAAWWGVTAAPIAGNNDAAAAAGAATAPAATAAAAQSRAAPAKGRPARRNNSGRAKRSAKKLRKTSQFRGVASTENGLWRARIRFGKYTVHLGRYSNEQAAALTYDRAATLLLGSDAKLNFEDGKRPEPSDDPAAFAHIAATVVHAVGADAPAAAVRLAQQQQQQPQPQPRRQQQQQQQPVPGNAGRPGGAAASLQPRPAAAADDGGAPKRKRGRPRKVKAPVDTGSHEAERARSGVADTDPQPDGAATPGSLPRAQPAPLRLPSPSLPPMAAALTTMPSAAISAGVAGAGAAMPRGFDDDDDGDDVQARRDAIEVYEWSQLGAALGAAVLAFTRPAPDDDGDTSGDEALLLAPAAAAEAAARANAAAPAALELVADAAPVAWAPALAEPLSLLGTKRARADAGLHAMGKRGRVGTGSTSTATPLSDNDDSQSSSSSSSGHGGGCSNGGTDSERDERGAFRGKGGRGGHRRGGAADGAQPQPQRAAALSALGQLLDADPQLLLWSLTRACKKDGAPPRGGGRREQLAWSERAATRAAAIAAISALVAAGSTGGKAGEL